MCGETACVYERDLVEKLSALVGRSWKEAAALEKSLDHAGQSTSTEEFALCCWKELLPEMEELRRCADAMEAVTDKTCWPYPSYGEVLFSVY